MFMLTDTPAKAPATAPAGVFVRESRQFNMYVRDDGTFRLDRLPPGAYHLNINTIKLGERLGLVTKHVQVPPVQEGEPTATVDIGTLTPKAAGR